MVALVELSGGGVGLLGPGRIVPAATAATLLDIQALRAAAEAEAAALVAAARDEADAVRAAARAEGLAAAEAEVQDRLFEIAEASIAAIARAEGRILDLALQIARRVLGDFDGAEAAARIASRGLRLAAHSAFVRLRVAPERVDDVSARIGRIAGDAIPLSAIEVTGDPAISDPGCVLETDAGVVDATVASQIAAIERHLRRAFATAAGEE